MILKCKNCGYEPDSLDCSACGEPVPLWAGFCPHCGEEAPPPAKTEGEGAAADRRLCPDGDCIGILNAEGRCVVCGRKAGAAA